MMDLRNVRIADPDPEEKIGRTITNAFGQSELVVMPWESWRYYDYMKRDSKRPIEEWVRECDLSRGNVPLGVALTNWIFWEFQAREKDGMSRPPYMPQQGQILSDDELCDCDDE